MTSLPKTPIKGDPETRRFLESVRQYLTSTSKEAITLSDLKDDTFWSRNGIVVPDIAVGGGSTAQPPTVPVNLTTSGVFQNIIIEWEVPVYRGHSVTRVYRSATNLFTDAVVIANVDAQVYADPVGPGATYYYWVSNVNVNGLESAPNQVAGTLGATQQDAGYMLDLLQGQITESQLSTSLGTRINLIDATSSVPGSVNARLQQEATTRAQAILNEASARANADSSLQTQINTIVAASTGDLQSVIAAVQQEQTARTNADAAEAAARETLATQIRGAYTGTDVAQLTTGLLYNERVARVSGDAAEASARQALSATVTNNYNTLNAAITAEQTARANADSALTSSINTLQASVNANTVAIQNEATARASADGSLSAQYTVKIDANGYVTGFGLASTANNAAPFSEFAVRADRFSIASPSGPGITPRFPFIVTTTPTVENGVTIQPGVYIDNAVIKDASITSAKIGALVADKITAGRLKVALGLDGDLNVGTGRIVFDTGTYMKVQGIAFGSSNQFIEWFGPKLASFSQCTEANAITYIKRDGSAYFGGSLSAGVLKNAARTTGIGPTEVIEVGPFGSNGGVRTVVLSYDYSYQWQITNALSYSGTPSAQIVLERANGSGGWTTLSTLNVTGTVTGSSGFGPSEPGYIQIAMGGSTTFTDTSGGLSCTYRGRMISRTLPSVTSSGTGFPTITQSVGVISTE